MDGVLISLIEKLPDAYIMVSLPVLLVSAIWLFSHIRRDRQGKIYFYSQKYEDRKRNRKQDAILTELRETKLDLMKLQILSTELAPNTKLTIYDNYRKAGGNSYIDEYVKKRVIPAVEAHTGFIEGRSL